LLDALTHWSLAMQLIAWFARFVSRAYRAALYRRGARYVGALAALTMLTTASVSHATIPDTERVVLQALFNSTNGNAWINKTNWNGALGTECTWFGVSCNADQSHVNRIFLNANALSGALPPTLNQLSALLLFNVNDNQLTGSIPSLSGLAALRGFEARTNQLSGSIPSLAGLSSLTLFNVRQNQLTGSIPPLAGLSTLGNLDVSQNQLIGSIPSLTGLSALSFFSVHSNQLSGSLPSLTGLSILNAFQARDNQLSGLIPQLTGLSELTFLNVSANRLTGPIPSLTGLVKLQVFNVFFNQLTGPIPSLSGLTELQQFLVSSNQLSGPIPAVPTPSALVLEGSSLCPNQLTVSPNAFWDVATANATWDVGCTAARSQQMLTFNVVPTLIPSGTGTAVVTVAPSPGSIQPIVYSSLTSAVCSVNAANGLITVLPAAVVGSVCTIAADKGSDQTINSAVQVRLSITVAAGLCRLDVSGGQAQNAAIDGVMILRYLSGVRGNALIAGLTLIGSRNNASSVESFLAAQNYDVQGNAATGARATRDGLVITRFLRNTPAPSMIAGTDIAAIEANNVRDRLVAWCTN
jgi:Leucine-rich repeat (LRR) protein